LREAGARLRRERQALFLNRLLGTASALRKNPQAVVAGFRADLARRYPDLPPISQNAISEPLLMRSLLALPLDPTRRTELSENGGALAFLRTLPPAAQELLTDFYGSAGGALDPETAEASSEATLAFLAHPRSRVEWRFLYGDAWTDTLFLARVGSGDSWATASLPGVLYSLPDYASLLPGIQPRPQGEELARKVAIRIDTTRQTWDQALGQLARVAKLNVLSDSYPRPSMARPEGLNAVVDAATVGDALDQLARQYGYVWWKVGDWYLFRHRFWYEEERASPAESTLRGVGEALIRAESVPQPVLAYLAGLDEQQLLTLDLMAVAAGGPSAPTSAFDYNRAQTLRQGLRLFEALTDDQHNVAAKEGVQFWQLNPAQQSLALTFAYDRGVAVDPELRQNWRFQVVSDVKSERSGGSLLATGALHLLFDFGDGGTRRMTLRLRLPAGRAETIAPGTPPVTPPPAAPPVAPPAASPPRAAPAPGTPPQRPTPIPMQPRGRD
jgi:hypothetical protein